MGEDASKQCVAFIAAYKDELHCSTRGLAKASTEEMVVLKSAYTLITIKTERKKDRKKSGEIKQYPEDKKQNEQTKKTYEWNILGKATIGLDKKNKTEQNRKTL